MRGLPICKAFDILRLMVVVPSATVVYLMSAKVLKIEALSLVTGGRKA
jgi:hypothetical protein